MAALGDASRRAIFELLADGPRPVGELADQLPISRPAVSQHLRVLRDAGLVTDRQVGTRRLYQVDPEGVAALRGYLDLFWNRSLAAFAAAIATEKGSPMTTQSTETAVRASVVVEAGQADAFTRFTERMADWWPPENHILQADLAEMVFEPRVGGSVYDRGVDGSESRWARVLAYEPPTRFVISWDIALSWQIETDPAKTSEVEVRFLAEGPDRTRVELEHRHLERHGQGWEQMRAAVSSEQGWAHGLRRFADHISAATQH